MQKINEIKPEDAEAYYNKGFDLIDHGKNEEALNYFTKSIKLNPNFANFYNGKGCALSNLCQYKSAIDSFQSAINLKLDYAVAYNNKGNALFNISQYNEAIDSYQQAIKLKPYDAVYYYNKGNALLDLCQYKDAIDSYQQAIKLKPDEAKYYCNKGNALSNLCQYKEAIDSYQQAIKLKPDEAKYYYGKGNALSNLCQYKEAINSYQQAIKPKSDYSDAYKQNQYEEAIECYDQAIKFNPEQCLYYCNRGKAYQFLKNNNQAISDFRKAKSMFDQGKVQGLTKANIAYIEETLSSVIKLLDVAAQIDLKFTELSRKASLILNNEAEELKNDVQKAVTNLTKNFDIKHKDIDKDIKPNLQETNQILERFRQLEAKIDALEKKNHDLEEQLHNKQDNHLLILDKKLSNIELTSQEKEKLIRYFKEFSNYLDQNYVAAVAMSSGKIAPKINSAPLSLINPVFKALEIATNYVNTQSTKNQSKSMAQIAHNTSAFNDIVGYASIVITLHKRQEILTVKKKAESGFLKFLQKTKDWVYEKFLGKIKDAPSHLKPVIGLAAKEATMLVAACLLGKITLDSDDANYTATKQKFIDIVVLNKKFRNEFDEALISKQSNYNDVCSIC